MKHLPQSGRFTNTMAPSFCVFMLIMLIRSFVCLQQELVRQWPHLPSSAIVLAAMSGRSAAGTTGAPNVVCPVKTSPLVKFVPAGRFTLGPRKQATLFGVKTVVRSEDDAHRSYNFSRNLQRGRRQIRKLHSVLRSPSPFVARTAYKKQYCSQVDDIIRIKYNF